MNDSNIEKRLLFAFQGYTCDSKSKRKRYVPMFCKCQARDLRVWKSITMLNEHLIIRMYSDKTD